MPNNIVNIVKVNGSDERVAEFFKAIKGANEVIDFNRIIPMPLEAERTYCDWARANWGTKWNAYQSRMIDDYTMKFETAWSGIPDLIGVLSTQWPDLEFEYMFADEDYSYNTGRGVIKDGDIDMIFPDGDSEEGWSIYFDTHEEMRDDFEFVDGTWRIKEE